VWEGFVPDVESGARYKYHITSQYKGYEVNKADPYGFAAEIRPQTASRVCDLSTYAWGDREWMAKRASRNGLACAISIYEVHPGSWKRVPEEGNRSLTYREMAVQLADYVHGAGYTHVEFLPVMEHPFDGSWGYEVIGYYAPTSRFGTPADFMYLVDCLHQRSIGVIIDWVPAHFPKDEAGLGYFDGTHLYEHSDPRQGEQPDWNTLVFNYGRSEVRGFLVANALFWFEKYHVDGLRVDAVASMLYLDYGRRPGQWIPNQYGGKENIDALQFLRKMNEQVYLAFPDAMMIAEESTAWPMVSRPTHLGGLGFNLKWNMGWMHDTLAYMARDPIYRQHHQGEMTFSLVYAFNENFVLPISHDEVVHGKGSLLNKMPGDRWQQFANLRTFLGYMFGHPGKKLLFMGCEFAQDCEWNHDHSLDWHLLDNPQHAGVQCLVRDLNHLYRATPALYSQDFVPAGFEWIDHSDNQRSVLSFVRWDTDQSSFVVVLCNFTPNVWTDYRLGVPRPGAYQELLNTDWAAYGGSNVCSLAAGNLATDTPWHGKLNSIVLTVPPLATVFLKWTA
jgi:1,4-alpha-glucan branching enzyme